MNYDLTVIKEKLDILKDKNFQIIISNYICKFENSELEFTVWSNSQQKNLTFKLEELNQDFSFNLFNEYLEKHVEKLEEVQSLGFETDNFKLFKYKSDVSVIEFSDHKYYGVETALNDIIEIIKSIKSEDKSTIIDYEKDFKKYCLNKKFDIYDFYMLVNEEKGEYVQNIFSFKESFNEKYGIGINVELLENDNNINILINKKRITINFKDTDIVKHYNYQTLDLEDFLIDSIKSFKNMIEKDVKLQKYMDFFMKNDFPRGTYIAKSHGYSVPHFYNPTFKEDVKKIKEIFDSNDIKKASNEFSEAEWIYRFKIAIKDLNNDNKLKPLRPLNN